MKSAIKGVIASILVLSSTAVFGSNPDDSIYRAPSASGLTGLLVMNIPQTMGPGLMLSVTAMGQGQFETLDNITTGSAALIVGFSENLELSARTKFISVEPVGGDTEQGMGDSEVTLKWKFRNQNENLPAMAVGIGGILPTGDADKGLTEVDNWGVRFLVTASGEVPVFADSFIGLYAEAQVVAIDKFGDEMPYSDKYGVFNLGLAFPISDNNRLHFILERNEIRKRNRGFPFERDYVAVTPGLRYASNHFSFAAGMQSLEYEDAPTTGDKYRLFATLSFGI